MAFSINILTYKINTNHYINKVPLFKITNETINDLNTTYYKIYNFQYE